MPTLFTHVVQPSLEVSLLPTWMSAMKSAFEVNGVSALGLYYEADWKLMYCPEFMQRAMPSARTGEGFGVAYLRTAGSVNGADMSGSGAQAILRMGF